MSPKAAIPAAKFQLRAVELSELIVKRSDYASTTKRLNFGINIEHEIDRDEHLVFITTSVIIYDEESDIELGSISCECIFSVDNFDEMIEMKLSGKSFEIREPFAETINAISISTTRGYMASELKGTFLHNAFLPVVDVKTLSKIPA